MVKISKNNPILVFRADGNSKTGLGHLNRVFSLIEMLKQDFRIELVTKEDSNLTVIPKEYKTVLLQANSQEEEIDQLFHRYCSSNTIFIFDGYTFDETYIKSIKDKKYRVVYIDDFAKDYMYADLVINHAVGASKDLYKTEPYTQLALGADYAMLRPSFLQKAKEDVVPCNNKKVLICFGGSDFEDLTRRFVRLLLNLDEEIEEINVILGSSYAFEFNIESPKIKIHTALSEKEMLKQMELNDRIIVPSSTILFEAICCKKHILTGYYVDNQKNIYSGFIKKNCVLGANNFTKQNDDYLKQKLKILLNEKTLDKLKKQKKLIDGNSDTRLKKLFLDLANESTDFSR